VAALLALALAFAWDAISALSQRNAKMAELNESLQALGAALPRLQGLEKERAALNAVALCESIYALDSENEAAWLEKAQGFKALIAGRRPEPGASAEAFIVQSALLEMKPLPPGLFYMGRRSYEKGGSDELPRHAVRIPYAFWLAATETSNAQMRRLVKDFRTPSWRGVNLNAPQQPAGCVDWNSALRFCQLLNETEKAANRLPDGYEYRLPTEAEWEYAARAGTETYYFWSDKFQSYAANFCNALDLAAADRFGWKREPDMLPSDGFIPSAPVGSFKPNAFGLCDTAGNVWEWTLDWYNPEAYRELPESAPFQAAPVKVQLTKSNPFGGKVWQVDSYCKAIRGGAWATAPESCRSATRDFVPPDYKNIDIGFRVALAPALKPLPAPEQAKEAQRQAPGASANPTKGHDLK
jgi:formylglycine-generating enzyme required for sulfatase activity